MTDTPRLPRRVELAQFLRTRRARLRPADVGLPEGARRRTPGLRREEVARLADVGVSWYTWLEQGRDIHVSEPLLERLALALRLSPTERAHLFDLAHGRPAARPTISPDAVSVILQRVLDAYPFPALVFTSRWDILAWNEPAVILFGDLGALPVEQRNGLWSMFMNPERRARMPGWEKDARRAVAGFRLDAARAADRTEFDALVAELSRVSPEFARFWGEHDVAEVPEGLKVFVLPDVGVIEFEHVTLLHADPDGHVLRVSFYSPRPGESTTRAETLCRRVTR
ncbi:helix-turn-helix transcriptional regulator [Polyangium mundeleinium]|uniref:Helix-turn-helix transcriptional regulator n=1 Tax=Polyangium mundeleinium TaxID=2995306 RepID=A0ABT5EY81_9BACT|nr:helix-turn-helix transcriptional regulator [Polyangium mundeleinium]MDC0746775.1 helix-turn-helix transcriptional regulator [Polyangium mundeleinium]